MNIRTHLNCVGSSARQTLHIIILLLDNLHLVEKKSEHFPGNYCKKLRRCNYLVLNCNFAKTDLQLAQVLLSN